jgi:hypothetical protein
METGSVVLSNRMLGYRGADAADVESHDRSLSEGQAAEPPA